MESSGEGNFYSGFAEGNSRHFAEGLNFYKLFWIFFICCFLGFIIETLYCAAKSGQIESRQGLIYGPFIPVYGFGGVVLTLCLYPFRNSSLIVVFLLAAFFGAAFEYYFSFFQELLLDTISWDYRGTFLNVAGRTSIKYAFYWGVLGVLWIRYVFPLVNRAIESIPAAPGLIITWLLIIFMVFNITVSAAAIKRQGERRVGKPANNSYRRFLDNNYSDGYLKKLFPYMKFVD